MADFAIFSTESEEYGKPAEYLAEIIIHNNNGGTIDLFSLGGLFSHFRPRDDTLENSCFQIFK